MKYGVWNDKTTSSLLDKKHDKRKQAEKKTCQSLTLFPRQRCSALLKTKKKLVKHAGKYNMPKHDTIKQADRINMPKKKVVKHAGK